ncbi:MAG: MFS transporter [Pseudomonadota bacterium]
MSGRVRVPLKTYLGLGLPMLAIGGWYYPILILLPPFLSEQYGLEMVAGALLAVRVFDLFTDTLAGRVSDMLPRLSGGRLGRRKPIIAFGLAIFSAAMIALILPGTLSDIAWLIAVMVLVMIGETMLRVPYKAWVAEAVTDYNARSRVAALRSLLVYLGVLIAAICSAIAESKTGGDPYWRFAGALIPVLIMALVFIPLSFVLLAEPETGGAAAEERAGFFTAVRQLSANAAFVRLAFINFIHEYADAINSALIVFFVVNVLLLPEDVGPSFVVSLLVGIGGLAFFTIVSQFFDKHRVMVAALIGAIATSLGALLIQPGNLTSLLIYMSVMAFFASADGVMMDAMEADLVDADEALSGERRAGLVAGTMNTIGKLPEVLGTSMVFVALAMLGFDPREETSDPASVRTLFVIVPVVLKLAVLALLLRYPLGGAAHARLRAELSKRQAAKG